jgi:hypothetical protein
LRYYPVLILLLLLTPQVLVAAPIARAVVSIGEDGVAVVQMEVQLTEGLNEVPLPVEPVELTLEVVPAEVTWVRDGLTLYLLSPRNLTATVTYVANVTPVGGTLVLRVADGARVRLELHSRVVLLSVPESVLNYEKLQGGGVAVELLGPATVEYTVTPETATPTPTTSPRPSPTPTTPVKVPPTTPTSPIPPTTPTPAITPAAVPAATWVAVAAVAVSVVATALALLTRRRS